jgi:hypothetical protein
VTYTYVDTGRNHTVLLASDGTAVVCGRNAFGGCSVPALSDGVIYTQVMVRGGNAIFVVVVCEQWSSMHRRAMHSRSPSYGARWQYLLCLHGGLLVAYMVYVGRIKPSATQPANQVPSQQTSHSGQPMSNSTSKLHCSFTYCMTGTATTPQLQLLHHRRHYRQQRKAAKPTSE